MKTTLQFVASLTAIVAMSWGWRFQKARHERPHLMTAAKSEIASSPIAREAMADNPGSRIPNEATSEVASATAPTLAAETTALLSEIREAFASFSATRLDIALAQLLPTLVQKNPLVAAELAESILEPNLRQEVMHVVARGWGKTDTESALHWAGSLPVEYEREAALTDAGAELARRDPAKALELSARAFRSDEPSPVLENLTQQWAEQDFNASLRWTLARSQGAQRDELLARLALIESRSSPEIAARLVAEKIAPGEIQREAIVSVVHQWAQRDWSSASAWIEQFPENSLRERAVAELDSIAKFRRTQVKE